MGQKHRGEKGDRDSRFTIRSSRFAKRERVRREGGREEGKEGGREGKREKEGHRHSREKEERES